MHAMSDSPKLPTPAELAKTLSQVSGEKITEAQVRADIEAGAPVEPDGRVNLVHYAAWLVKAVTRR